VTAEAFVRIRSLAVSGNRNFKRDVMKTDAKPRIYQSIVKSYVKSLRAKIHSQNELTGNRLKEVNSAISKMSNHWSVGVCDKTREADGPKKLMFLEEVSYSGVLAVFISLWTYWASRQSNYYSVLSRSCTKSDFSSQC
jgi:ribosomal protein S20